MASSFSAKRGSEDTLKVSIRCGLSPCLCQMRRMVTGLRPVAAAMLRVDHCVALAGLSWVVLSITNFTVAAEMRGVRPLRGALSLVPPDPDRGTGDANARL